MENILRVDETVLLKIEQPAELGEPFLLSGKFFDKSGNQLFEIAKNEWFGNSSNWDINCVGGRTIIRTSPSVIALQILAIPPNGILIEKMDMIYKDTHFIATEYFFRATAFDNSGIKIIGRKIVAETKGCDFISALSENNWIKSAIRTYPKLDGALYIGGGGKFRMESLPTPKTFPKNLKGKMLKKDWGKIKFIVPQKKRHITIDLAEWHQQNPD